MKKIVFALLFCVACFGAGVFDDAFSRDSGRKSSNKSVNCDDEAVVADLNKKFRQLMRVAIKANKNDKNIRTMLDAVGEKGTMEMFDFTFSEFDEVERDVSKKHLECQVYVNMTMFGQRLGDDLLEYAVDYSNGIKTSFDMGFFD